MSSSPTVRGTSSFHDDVAAAQIYPAAAYTAAVNHRASPFDSFAFKPTEIYVGHQEMQFSAVPETRMCLMGLLGIFALLLRRRGRIFAMIRAHAWTKQ